MRIEDIEKLVADLPFLSDYVAKLKGENRPYLTEHHDLEFPPQLCCGITKKLPLAPVLLNGCIYDLGSLLALSVDIQGRRQINEVLFSLGDIKTAPEVIVTTQQYYERMTQPRKTKISSGLQLEIQSYAKKKENCPDSDLKKQVSKALDGVLEKNGGNLSVVELNALIPSEDKDRKALFNASFGVSKFKLLVLQLYQELGFEEVSATDLDLGVPSWQEKEGINYGQALAALVLLHPHIKHDGNNSFCALVRDQPSQALAIIKVALILLGNLDPRGLFCGTDYSLPPLAPLAREARAFLAMNARLFQGRFPGLAPQIAQALCKKPSL